MLVHQEVVVLDLLPPFLSLLALILGGVVVGTGGVELGVVVVVVVLEDGDELF